MSDKVVEEAQKLRAQGKSWPVIYAALDVKGEWLKHRVSRAHLKALRAVPGRGYAPARLEKEPKHPNGWEPGIDTAKGTIVAAPSKERDVCWDKELERLGFDPTQFEIVEPFHVRTWDGYIKNPAGQIETVQLWYHKANIIRRRSADDRVDIDALLELVGKAPAAPPVAVGDQGFVFIWSDAQIGKGEGDGSKGTVDRMVASIDAGVHRLEELRTLGRKVDLVHLHIGADMFEANAGHYAMQTFGTDLNERDQKKIARRLVKLAIDRFVATGSKVLVTVVPGNHGENRLNGKAFTTFGDNGDVEIVEQVAEICEANPAAYSNVRFIIPREEMELTVDVHGTVLGLAHGHQARGGVERWWKEQMLGRQPIGSADILLTGHKHELVIQCLDGRWWFQSPALESESTWFKHTHGDSGHPGVLTFLTANHGWSDLQVL